jgi:O-antigen/teichoic acid export membrane protein
MNVEWVFDVAFPSAVVIALCAPPLVNLALGPRWAEVATVLPFLAIASSGRTLVMLGNALMNGLGRPDLTMRMNLILVGITYALYVPTVSLMGLRGVGVALMVGQLVTLPIYATFVKRVISIPRREMLRRLVPGLLLGASVAAASLLGRIGTAPWVLVATLGGVGAVYVMVAWVLWRVRRVGPVMILQRLRSAYGR